MSGCARKGSYCGRCESPLDFDFTMAFQPIVDLADRRAYGYEALVRGVDNASAGVILSQVDEKSLYRFDQTCRVKAIELAHKLQLGCVLSINFLPNAVYDPDACIQTTLKVANELGWSPQQICFEITETEYVQDRTHLQNIVTAYQEYGFTVALDDFGSGYANLDLLVDMRPDVLKLDRVFIRDVHQDIRRQSLVHGVIALARVMDIAVIAEGVETVDEARWLYRAGIVRHQGFLYARPGLEQLPNCDSQTFSDVCTA